MDSLYTIESPNVMVGALIIFLLVVVAVYGYVRMNPPVATGVSGGATLPINSSSVVQPNVAVSTPNGTAVVPSNTLATVPYAATAVVPPVLPKLVKYIKLSKSMVDETVADYRTLQVAEVKAFTDAGQIDSSLYSDVSYADGLGKQVAGQAGYPARNIIDNNLNTFTETGGTETAGPMPIHSLTLTLKDPVKIVRVEVYNRTSYMPERLGGTIVTLLAADGSTIWTSGKLTAATTVQILNPQYSSGFMSGFTSYSSPAAVVKKLLRF